MNELLIVLPFIIGIIMAVSNYYVKLGSAKISFSHLRSFINFPLILGLILGFIGTIGLFYAYKFVELWKVMVIVNVTVICTAILLGVVLLEEKITPLNLLFVALTLVFLVLAIVVK